MTDSDFRSADDSGILVPSRHQIVRFLANAEQPVHIHQLCRHFGLLGEEAYQATSARMERLKRLRVVREGKNQRFSLIDPKSIITGRVIGHPDGYGFVRPDVGEADIFLPRMQMLRVLHGDKVLIQRKDHPADSREEGVILEVQIDPGREIVGYFRRDGNRGQVSPKDPRFCQIIEIPEGRFGNACPGDLVVVKLIRHPVLSRRAVGDIQHILGNKLSAGMETEIAIRNHEIPTDWPEAVTEQLVTDHRRLRLARMDRSRRDLRDLPVLTIDGADAQDFDDAVYCERISRGWRLVVCIADVSHYVQVDTPLDHEARKRGNSVYFPNRVVPMLPEVLSHGICSLSPDEDRCCMVCDMQISHSGKIQEYEFYPALMRSRARLTYDEVAGIVSDTSGELKQKWSHVCEELDRLLSLYTVLVKQRNRRGAIQFEFPEAQIHLDDCGRVRNITVRERNVAHQIIEECMLAANVCAGELLQEHFGHAGIFRNHPGPEPDALSQLRIWLKENGLHLPGEHAPTASDFSLVLAQAEKRPAIHRVVQTLLLRSLDPANYTAEPMGHFALGYPVYTHFTSPIRRYPDLVVHRLIRRILFGSRKRILAGETTLAQVGAHCSVTERRAEEAVRDVVSWLKAKYIQGYVGEPFDGMVSHVAKFGLFVQLDHILVDGLVHVSSLGRDFYSHDPLYHTLTGERNGRQFKLGDRVRVRVSDVDLDRVRVNLELMSSSSQGETPRRKHGKRPRKSRG